MCIIKIEKVSFVPFIQKEVVPMKQPVGIG